MTQLFSDSEIKILIVEDDDLMRQELLLCFSATIGFSADCASSGEAALVWLAQNKPPVRAILILDLTLPDMDGCEVLRKAVEHCRHVAIIVVTSRTDIESRVITLERGADAYLCKPFDRRELITTVFAVCRRVFPSDADLVEPCWQLSPRNFNLTAPTGIQINLTIHEIQLLSLLQQHEGKVVSRLKISESLGNIYRFSGNALEALISRLRRKVALAYPDVNLIEAVSGEGYRLAVKLR